MEAWRLCRGTYAKKCYTVYIEQDAGRNDSGADQEAPGQIGYTNAIRMLYKAVGIVPLPFFGLYTIREKEISVPTLEKQDAYLRKRGREQACHVHDAIINRSRWESNHEASVRNRSGISVRPSGQNITL